MDSSILIVLAVLAATVVLLVSELVRIDVVAIICMLALAWLGVLAPHEALSGFSSNAVIAMMAVMIMGQGVARTGLMDRFSRAVVGLAGTRRTRLVAMVSVPVGLVSGLIQNIGAVALFLPGVLDIARREKIAASSLIMPIGFAAILGGTLTMVGSGPLILTNDLLRGANLAPYGLFSVTPVGLALLAVGIGYFALVGRFVLPVSGAQLWCDSRSGPRVVERVNTLCRRPGVCMSVQHRAESGGESLGKTSGPRASCGGFPQPA
jgi:di/tricarboxylate transporter